MDPTPHTIPILPALAGSAPLAGCGACPQGEGGQPVCRAVLDSAGMAPTLSGPADEVQRLLAALTPVLGAVHGSGLVRALHVQAGEVELQLAVRAGCGGAALADSAFHTLRGLLPDTDICVLPAR